MVPKIERVVDGDGILLGEAPHWDAATQTLYFVDIYGKAIHKYVPSTNKHTSALIGTDIVSIIIPVANTADKFLISIGRQLVVVTWDGESKEVFKTEKFAEVDDEDGYRNNIFNDGKADATGRLFIGSMARIGADGKFTPNMGSLYSFGPKGEIKVHLSKSLGVSNGLAWSCDNTKFYYIDSLKNTVAQYDYDISSATISNEKTVYTHSKHNIEGGLDGMNIDADNNLWLATFLGSTIIKINPNEPETILDTITLPAKQVTSMAFGGPNLDELYVTIAALPVGGVEHPPPVHGALYRITGTGSKGRPGSNVTLD